MLELYLQRMEFDYLKCHLVRFGSSETPSYILDDEKPCQIAPAAEERDLGVIFDKTLTFTNHIKAKIATLTVLFTFQTLLPESNT